MPGPPPEREEAPPEPVRQMPAATVRCPNCRTENAADRTLCVRCALLLDPGPPPAVRPPWWRRLLRRERRAAPVAGTRPRPAWRRPRVALPVVLLLLAVGVWFALPHMGNWLGLARDETGMPESLPPAAVRASSALKGHPADAAFDGFTNRYWAPATQDGATLEADFEAPGVRVTKLVVFGGTSAKKDEFLTQARPARIQVELIAADGNTSTHHITLKDQPGQQTFDVRGKDVVRARLAPETWYGAGHGHRLALAEVEFFGHRS
ncbi:discoidin domain-containing protein [Streptomyces sp. NPDC048717]|uniref:discoidin domain-containing protein n=1 Tax=Streptomyces sp. NPDC048717 TaxID=3154928 RepID=UPI00343A8246